jgi:hypothetical protein
VRQNSRGNVEPVQMEKCGHMVLYFVQVDSVFWLTVMSGLPAAADDDLDDIPMTPSDEELLSGEELEEAMSSLVDGPEINSGTVHPSESAPLGLTAGGKSPLFHHHLYNVMLLKEIL